MYSSLTLTFPYIFQQTFIYLFLTILTNMITSWYIELFASITFVSNLIFRNVGKQENTRLYYLNSNFLGWGIDQELISVRALVFDLAQLTCQKRFNCRNAIIRSSETFLDTSLSQIVVAVFVYDNILYIPYVAKGKGKNERKNKHDIRQLLFLQHISGLISYLNLCNGCRQ